MHVDSEAITTRLECVTNCTDSDEEGAVVNLHPELLIPAGEEYQDSSLPWLGEMMRIAQNAMEKNPKLRDRKFIAAARAAGSPRLGQVSQEWSSLKTAWSLHNRGKKELAEAILAKHHAKIQERPKSVPDWVISFTTTVVGASGDKQFTMLAEALRKSRRSGESYKAYCRFVRDEHRTHIGDYYKMYLDFVEHYSEYSQVVLYVYSGLEVPEDFHATSHAFRQTQMFYGNAFEVLTSRVIALATLSNLLKGRTYDQFERLPSLKAYRELKKESKCGPFQDIAELSWICDDLDTSLRNASHHAAISYDASNATVTYRSGGTGAVRTMSYAQYLLKCFDLFRRLGVLLRFEITVSQIADQYD